jgi:hypothetical protein
MRVMPYPCLYLPAGNYYGERYYWFPKKKKITHWAKKFGRIFAQSGHPACKARHRNLSTKTCMFELLLQTFWAKKPYKKSADLHPRQGNLHTTLEHFYRAQQNLSSLRKIPRVETSWKRNSPFFQHTCSRSRFLWMAAQVIAFNSFRVLPNIGLAC